MGDLRAPTIFLYALFWGPVTRQCSFEDFWSMALLRGEHHFWIAKQESFLIMTTSRRNEIFQEENMLTREKWLQSYTFPHIIMVQWKMGVSPILASFHVG